jgi:hypothetical protein
VQLIPEVAPRLRIDAGRRLVEQQELRLVQETRGERQALLPTAGELARELLRAIDEPEPLQRCSTRSSTCPSNTSARRSEVLADRQVFPQREALRHVADVTLDRLRLAPDVEAEARSLRRCRASGARTASGWTSSCRCHWAQEAEDLAAQHRQREILDDVMRTEALVEPADVDDDFTGHDGALMPSCIAHWTTSALALRSIRARERPFALIAPAASRRPAVPDAA